MFLKHFWKTRKKFKNPSPIKLLFKTFLKHHLCILKTFLKCQIVGGNSLVSAHVPGKLNIQDDAMSRSLTVHTELLT